MSGRSARCVVLRRIQQQGLAGGNARLPAFFRLAGSGGKAVSPKASRSRSSGDASLLELLPQPAPTRPARPPGIGQHRLLIADAVPDASHGLKLDRVDLRRLVCRERRTPGGIEPRSVTSSARPPHVEPRGSPGVLSKIRTAREPLDLPQHAGCILKQSGSASRGRSGTRSARKTPAIK